MTPRDPTSAEWALAVQAAVLVAVVAGLHLARPLLARAAGAAKVAVVALATMASSLVLVVVVLLAAAVRAGGIDIAAPTFEEANYPAGLLSLRLIGFQPAVIEDASGYAAAVLLPIAALCAVLAAAVAAAPRRSALRWVASGTLAVLLLVATVIALGDAGGLAAGAGWWLANLALVGLLALVADGARSARPDPPR